MSSNTPLISVIIPYYNPPFKYFQEAIESVLAQGYTNWELVIVNDSSSNESSNNLENYIGKINDKRIHLIHLPKNSGVSVAKNKGIELSKGEIITFLDADDLLLPWDFEGISKHFLQNPDVLILSSNYLYYLRLGTRKILVTSAIYNAFLNDTSTEKKILSDIKEGRHCIFPRLCLKREVANKFTFDENLKRGEDTDLLIWILNNENLLERLSILPQAGYVYRFYPSRNRLSQNLNFRFKAIKLLEEKYKSNNNSLGYRVLKIIIDDLYEGKLIKLIGENPENECILFSLFKIILCPYSYKEKVSGFKIILKIILEYYFLLPFIGVSYRYYEKLFKKRDNMIKDFKKVFNNYKTNINKDKKNMDYILKLERAIF